MKHLCWKSLAVLVWLYNYHNRCWFWWDMEEKYHNNCTRHIFHTIMPASSCCSTPRHRKRRRREDTERFKMRFLYRSYIRRPWQNIFMSFNLVFFCLNLVISLCGAFNLDTRVPIVKSGIKSGSLDDAYFGYSVAMHRTLRSKEHGESVILVGAPRDDNLQPNTHRSGALWQCPLTAAINVS